jgi:membrane-bound lytic murein transglycosylase B
VTVPPLPSFGEWLQTVRADALARGIKPSTLDIALTDLAPVDIVLERDRQQAEFTLDLSAYLRRRLAPETVRTARHRLKDRASLTQRVAAAYGVEPRVQIAVWGLESNFGRFSGVRPVIPSLATLAYDDRRRGLFRGELLDALTILDTGDMQYEELRGSWAGAMGQTQFLPSSYLSWAVDFDKDGRRNIWSSEPDVFASIANYLRGHGWVKGVRWGYAVAVPSRAAARVAEVPLRASGCRAVRDLSEPRSLKEWKALGITPARGATAVPSSTRQASLLRIDNKAWLVTGNYEALLGYNCAHTYALSVATLADRLATR